MTDPVDLQTSIEMAMIAAEDGVETIIATPLIKEILDPIDKLYSFVSEFNIRLEYQNIPVNLLLGVDVFELISPTPLKDYTINNSRYLRLEFPHNSLPSNSREIRFPLVMQRVFTIDYLSGKKLGYYEKQALLLDMLYANVLVQISASSPTGELGYEEHRPAPVISFGKGQCTLSQLMPIRRTSGVRCSQME